MALAAGNGIVIVPHRFEGVFITEGESNVFLTKNLVPGEVDYNERSITVQNEDGTEVEYRIWDPLCSKLATLIIIGPDNIHIKPGSKVLYLGASCGATVSLVSDIIGPTGLVYAVEFSHRSEPDLVNLAKKRTNVIPIFEDPRDPAKYYKLVGMVDVILSEIDQPDQVRILALNALQYLKIEGHFVLSTKAIDDVDSTLFSLPGYEIEAQKLMKEQFKPRDYLSLIQFENDHYFVIGAYKIPSKMLGTQLQVSDLIKCNI